MAKPDDDNTNSAPQDPVKTALFKALGHVVSPEPTPVPDAPAPESVVEDPPLIPKKEFDEEEFKGAHGSLRERLRYMRQQQEPAADPEPPTDPTADPTPEPTLDPDDKVVVKRPEIKAPPTPPAPEPAPEPAPAPVPEDIADLTDEEQEEIELARFAEEADPKKYAGYTKKVSDFIKKHREFMAKQQENDPMIEFDRDNDTYQSFLRTNKPAFNPTERKKLTRAKLIDEAKREAKKELSAETEELRTKLREIEVRPQIKSTVEKLKDETIKLIDHEAAKAIREKGREAASTDYALEASIINESVELAANAANEFLAITQGLTKPDAKNQTHVWLFDFIQEQTELFEKHGGDARVRDGKRFVSRQRFAQMKPDEREKHFTLTDTDLLQLIALSAKYGVEKRLREEQERLEKAGYVKKTATTVTPAPRSTETAPPRARSTPAPGSSELTPPPRDPFLASIMGR